MSTTKLQQITEVYRPFSDAKIGVACIKEDGTCLFANDTFTHILGYGTNELQGQSFLLLFEQKRHKQTSARLATLFKGKINSYKLKLNLLKKNMSVFSASVCVSTIQDEANVAIAAIVIISGISADADQLLEVKKLSYAVEYSGSAVMITDANGCIEYANARFTDMTGYPLNELLGNTPALLRSDQTHANIYRDLWNNVLANKQWRGTLVNRRKDGSLYWSYQSIAPIIDQSGTLVSIVSVSEDITRIKEHEKQMEQLAFFDPLTALGNRRKFRDALNQIIATPDTFNRALLLLDLDHFKQVNDTLGHDTGDQLLIAIANRLRFCTNENYTAFRLGGDEFTVLVHRADNLNTIEQLALEIIELLAQPIQIDSHEILITVSLGITLIHADGDEAGDLLKNADLAMYEAKRLGRNTFAFFKPHMDFEFKRALSLEMNLRHAIDHEELSLVFQPLIDLRTGKITGLEALSRWHHSIEGDIPVADFIQKAEDTGLIIPLGNWVLKKAMEVVLQLHLAGYPELMLSINISTRQLLNHSLITTLNEVLTETGFSPDQLTLEITGELSLSSIDSVLDTLKQIKSLGVTLAIDDFGTGGISLNNLRQMPIDILKIDTSFIQGLPNEHDSTIITSTVIAMAEKLGLRPHAEGIETQEQQQFLLTNHCFSGQGYLYSAPLSVEQLLCTLEENTGLFIDHSLSESDVRQIQ
ncbi:EAL domain-containing protein [Neptunomonas antarctica]|nr:EAL domain-containing protein [Neptunomonas antarctica]